MEFESYITYEEYTELSGKVTEGVFSKILRKAQRTLDAITFNRIPYLTKIPYSVKEVLAEFIDRMYSVESGSSGTISVASSYSNGIESIDFKDDADGQLKKELVRIAVEWLPDYLVARSVNFDVEEYLQSESNNPQ